MRRPTPPGKIEVEAVTVDDLVAAGRLPRPSVVKIDVEGAEEDVLAGMAETLATVGPTLIVEVDGPDDEALARRRAGVVAQLASAGYTVEELEPSYPGMTWKVAHLLAPSRCDVMSADAVDRREGLVSDDWYPDPMAEGSVIGSVGPGGALRRGVDVENRVSADNGALRFEPLDRPGWGRQGVAYGPFPPEPGLAFAAHVLNGHHASQTYYFHEPSRRTRLRRWLGEARRGRFRRPHHYENLAVGFFPEPVPSDPLKDAHAFVVHAATEDNGELWVASLGRPVRAVRGVLNVPFVFVIVLRHDGEAAYYTSSLPGTTGAAPYPALRPLGIGSILGGTPSVFGGIQQRILGEVGYRVATRVYGARVAVVPEWGNWYGSAAVADRLYGEGALVGTTAERGATWQELGASSLQRTPDGVRATGPEPSGASLSVGTSVGLLRALLRPTADGTAEVCWGEPHGATARVSVDATGAAVGGLGGAAVDRFALPEGNTPERVVQVLDDGRRVAVHVDGALLGDRWWPSNGDATEVGIVASAGSTVRFFEAHAREIAMPSAIDVGPVWQPPPSRVVFDERFDLTADDLVGSTTPSGGRTWDRAEGLGRISLRGVEGARVVASRHEPNPGRTIFTVDWDDPSFADVSIEMTPPGTARGQGEAGRVGMVFWQDPENYLVVNVYVDDDFDGASISTFYRIGGHENMYDAVWTLVRGMTYGERCTLRTAFDGERFLSWANEEPALVRALTDVYPDAPRLRIERLGLIVNEEWGDDTGSVIHRYLGAVRADREALDTSKSS